MHSNGLVWVRGKGAILEDADGKEYLDGLAGLWNNTAGHGQQTLVDAASQQMATLPYASGYTGSTNPKAIELAERLSEIMYPKINHFFFTSGGGESSDSNFKMARYYWKLKGKPEKTKVISRQWGYHGVTLAAMCATGISSYWPMFEPRIPGFVHIPSPYPYRYQAPEPYSGKDRKQWQCSWQSQFREPAGSSFPKMIILRESEKSAISMRSCSWQMKSSPVSEEPEPCSDSSIGESNPI